MPTQAYAASKNVKISLPNFNVTLNSVPVENSYRQYPLIVYKDITYFPATFYDSRFLGIETKWDSQKGLFVNDTGISGSYRDYKSKKKNSSVYTAAVAPFAVHVNGKTIDNNKEEYPFLVFRDVTYFPLTWRFARDEFGWSYRFDNKSGLDIRSDNPKLTGQDIMKYNENGFISDSDGFISHGNSFVAYKNNYYYTGNDEIIYMTEDGDLKNSKSIYQLPLWSHGDDKTYVFPSLTKNDQGVWLSYHQGGAVMGYDEYINFMENGESEKVEAGYITFKKFGDFTVKILQGGAPGPGNLFIRYKAQEYKQLGDNEHLYGWEWEQTETTASGSASRDLYLKDNAVYLLGFDTKEIAGKSSIYKVDISTNKTTKVSNLTARAFKLEGDTLYFSNGGSLYSLPLNEGKENLIKTAEPAGNEFQLQVLDGTVYYAGETDKRLYNTASDKSPNPNAKVKGIKLEDGYIITIFEEDKNNPYNLMIFDKNADVIFKTADSMYFNSVSIDNDKLYYVADSGKTLYKADLKVKN